MSQTQMSQFYCLFYMTSFFFFKLKCLSYFHDLVHKSVFFSLLLEDIDCSYQSSTPPTADKQIASRMCQRFGSSITWPEKQVSLHAVS